MSTFTDPAAAGKLVCAPACQDQEAPFRAEPEVEGDGWWPQPGTAPASEAREAADMEAGA